MELFSKGDQYSIKKGHDHQALLKERISVFIYCLLFNQQVQSIEKHNLYFIYICTCIYFDPLAFQGNSFVLLDSRSFIFDNLALTEDSINYSYEILGALCIFADFCICFEDMKVRERFIMGCWFILSGNGDIFWSFFTKMSFHGLLQSKFESPFKSHGKLLAKGSDFPAFNWKRSNIVSYAWI